MNEPTLPGWVEEGAKIRYLYHQGKVNVLAHIRAVIDGEKIVYAIWSVRKQRFIYHMESLFQFTWDIADGKIKYEGQDKGWMAKGYPCER